MDITKKELNRYKSLLYAEFIENHSDAFDGTSGIVYIYLIDGFLSNSEYSKRYVILSHKSQLNDNLAKSMGFTSYDSKLLYTADRQTKTLTPSF